MKEIVAPGARAGNRGSSHEKRSQFEVVIIKFLVRTNNAASSVLHATIDTNLILNARA